MSNWHQLVAGCENSRYHWNISKSIGLSFIQIYVYPHTVVECIRNFEYEIVNINITVLKYKVLHDPYLLPAITVKPDNISRFLESPLCVPRSKATMASRQLYI